MRGRPDSYLRYRSVLPLKLSRGRSVQGFSTPIQSERQVSRDCLGKTLTLTSFEPLEALPTSSISHHLSPVIMYLPSSIFRAVSWTEHDMGENLGEVEFSGLGGNHDVQEDSSLKKIEFLCLGNSILARR